MLAARRNSNNLRCFCFVSALQPQQWTRQCIWVFSWPREMHICSISPSVDRISLRLFRRSPFQSSTFIALQSTVLAKWHMYPGIHPISYTICSFTHCVQAPHVAEEPPARLAFAIFFQDVAAINEDSVPYRRCRSRACSRLC